MNALDLTSTSYTFLEIHNECLVNSSEFCEHHRDSSTTHNSICDILNRELTDEFGDKSQVLCDTLLTFMFLSQYCFKEQNITTLSFNDVCINSYALPFGLCSYNDVDFLTTGHINCFNFFANFTDMKHYSAMTTANLFWFTMENTCQQPNASMFGICSGYLFMQEKAFNMTKFLDNELDWFYTKYLYPCLSLFVFVMNLFWILSIVRTNIMRPTKITMYTLAIAEILGSLGFLPVVIYYINLGNYVSFVPYTVCILIMFILYVFTPIMHGLFLWNSAALAAQRLFVVSYPFLASQQTYKKSLKRPIAFVICICTVLFIIHSSIIQYIWNIPSIEVPMKSDISVTLLTSQLPDIVIASHDGINVGVGVILQTLGIQILPTLIIVFVCIRLRIVIARQKATQKYLSEIPNNQKNQLDIVNTVTLVITVFVLLAEIPNNILAVISSLNFTGVCNIDMSTVLFRSIAFASKVFSSLSYANFIICYCVGKEFRESFKSIFKCSKI